MDKFALVYEFNKDSPLITYEASKELDNKNYEGALKLLEAAANKYPYHPTVYFLNGIALAHKNQFELAKENIIKGDNLLNEKSTFDFYLKEIERIKLKKEGIDLTMDNTGENILDNPIIDKTISEKKNDFDFLDKETDEPKINELKKVKPIVTETLAEIYASQGNYKEALDIYEKLKIVKPELSEKFDNRIREISLAIENKKTK
ncbi:MAG: tetratricopeptide repeat-containing protein [Ignavibacteriales bacterium]|nr:tetratricopeptide repeat-containing protein [Ignavibacteriota bacterium]MCB9249622.1 tetratricopeptide repeat-containing protein [Ignavibacteriales bacterium]